jgi:hypothetical protein
VIRRISFAVLALAALATAACSNPTAPAAKAPRPSANVAADTIVQATAQPTIIVQGSGT